MKLSEAIEKKAILGQNLATAADGGHLANPELIEVTRPNFMAGTLYSRCRIRNARGPSVKLPMLDSSEAQPVSAYWVQEGWTKTSDKAAFDQIDAQLFSLAAVIPVTEELLQDVTLASETITSLTELAIRGSVDRALIHGNGVTQPAGLLNWDATLEVPATGDIVGETAAMYAAYTGSASGVWAVGRSTWKRIIQAHAADFPYNANNGTLYGLPVIVHENVDAAVLALVDFSQVVIAQNELRESVSRSIYFSTDQTAFRSVIRVAYIPAWNEAMDVDGEDVSPYVVLGGAEDDTEDEQPDEDVEVQWFSPLAEKYAETDEGGLISMTGDAVDAFDGSVLTGVCFTGEEGEDGSGYGSVTVVQPSTSVAAVFVNLTIPEGATITASISTLALPNTWTIVETGLECADGENIFDIEDATVDGIAVILTGIQAGETVCINDVGYYSDEPVEN
jgi:HK97 family phage major capsid protein